MSETPDEQDVPFEEPEAPVVDDDPDQTEGDEEEEVATEPTPEPEPEQQSDEDRVKLAKALDTRFKSYQTSVEKNLGDEVTNWLLCPLCASGMAPGFVNRHDLGRVPDEVQANVQTFLGYAREGEYEDAPGVRACTDCAGRGKVKTGSLVAEHATITCPTCKGYGYVPPPGAHALHSVAVGNGQHEPADPAADLETPDRDNWGEPRILPDGTLNDNYGKQPQFKTRHPVYGETRLLTPEELVSG